MGLIIFLGALFMAIGLLVTKKNAAHVFTTYSHLPYLTRSKVDASREAKAFRRFHFFLGGSLLLVGLGIYDLVDSMAAILFAVLYPLAAYLFFMARSFKGSTRKEARALTFGIFVMAGSILVVLLVLRWGFSPNDFLVNNDMIAITGPYGEKIRAADIASVEIIDTLPPVKVKKNGISIGRINKGFFLLADGETIKLLLDGTYGPYLLITRVSGERLFYRSPARRAEELAEQVRRILPAGSR